MPLDGGALLLVHLNDMQRRMTSGSVAVGFFDSESATIAAINEEGRTKANIPPRPFMRLTVHMNRKTWVHLLAEMLKESRTSKVLPVMGKLMQADMRVTLANSGLYAPNAKRTVRKKGFNAPMTETGAVLGPKIQFEVQR